MECIIKEISEYEDKQCSSFGQIQDPLKILV